LLLAFNSLSATKSPGRFIDAGRRWTTRKFFAAPLKPKSVFFIFQSPPQGGPGA
jgi:hypothetical protein